MLRYIPMLATLLFLSAGIAPEKKPKPTIYLVGDSTVKNGSGKGEGGLWGWGDYVLIQFGHNDSSPVNDNSRARGTLKGTGEETEEIDNILTKKHEIVHTYGWYIRKYISDAKAKGAIPIICSLVPRNNWENGRIPRASEDYVKWAKESAGSGEAFFINLNEIIAAKYDALWENEVTSKLFLTDNTHTNSAGAIINAQSVAEGIKQLKRCKLKKFLLAQ